MAKSPNFSGLLDAAPTEVERPKPCPTGLYLWVVVGKPRYDKSSKKQTDFAEFTLKALQAGSDVDSEELDTYLTNLDGTKRGLDTLTTKATFYLTEGAIWRLDEFHEHCGIDLSVEASRRERSEECQNSQICGYINHEPSNDGESVFARLGKTMSADDFGTEEEAEAA